MGERGKNRRYDDEMLRDLLNKSKPQIQKKTVLYARVSSSGQSDDLKRQISKLETFALSRGYCYEIYQDIGSGLNFNRKEFNRLVLEILSSKVDRVIVNYKDRLMRFGLNRQPIKWKATISVILTTTVSLHLSKTNIRF
ncbi:TPA: IS607 family transposase [Candidatus Poribacteria bacterium]|nr:IS607 family transposase [Candidatus Poribacteria bacterium]